MLSGLLPSRIWYMRYLKKLDLRKNNLSVEIPNIPLDTVDLSMAIDTIDLSGLIWMHVYSLQSTSTHVDRNEYMRIQIRP